MKASAPRLQAAIARGVRRLAASVLLLALPPAWAAPSTTLLLRDAPSPSVAGQAILLAARVDVAGVAPTGTVTLGDADSTCTATLPVAHCLWLPAGDGVKSLKAIYSGDANHTGSESAITLHSVVPRSLPERVSLGAALPAYLADDAGLRFDASAEGRFVVFESARDDLVPGDANGVTDIFVADRMSGTVQRVSVADDEAQANAASSQPTVSADGSRVAFLSAASNLVAGDGNAAVDVFVRDRSAGTTVRANLGAAGVEANAGAFNPRISHDGSRVAFQSAASNLVAGDTNGVDDVFLHTLAGAVTLRVSVSSAQLQANGPSTQPTLSQDGDVVAFLSGAGNLVPVDNNGSGSDVFVHRVGAGTTAIASVNDAGTVAAAQSVSSALPGISGDGRFVAFASDANYVAADTGGFSDLFRADLLGTPTIRVSLADDEAPLNAGVQAVAGDGISFDGSRILFATTADNAVAGDGNLNFDLFLRDVDVGSTRRLTLRSDGSESAFSVGDFASLSADGLVALFLGSIDGGFVPGGSNSHLVVRDIASGVNAGTLPEPAGNQLRRAAGAAQLDATAGLSADGRFVVFSSVDDHLVEGDSNRAMDVFVRDRQMGTVRRVSVASSGNQANAASGRARISVDGRYVVFESLASNLVTGDANGVQDVFRHDLQSGTTVRVSTTPADVDPNGASQDPVLSADGRWVAFASAADNLIAGDGNGVADIFLWDAEEPAATRVQRVSVSLLGVEGDAPAANPAISADGNRIAFESASHLLSADAAADGLPDIYLRDRAAATMILASRLADGSEGGSVYRMPQLSSDGRVLAYLAEAGGEDFEGDGLVEVSAGPLVVVRDLSGLTSRVASRCAGVGQLAGLDLVDPAPFALSGSGQYVVFATPTLSCTPDDFDATPRRHVFVRDLSMGETRLVDRTAAGVEADGGAAGNNGNLLAVSPDGSGILFASQADELAPGDDNGVDDLFLVANPAYRTDALQTVSGVTATANGPSRKAVLSADGRYLVFESEANNLGTGGAIDTNGSTDVYRRDLLTGQVERVSLGDGGQQLDGAAVDPIISPDGALVIFAAADSAVALSKRETQAQRKQRLKALGTSLFLRNLKLGSTLALAQLASNPLLLNQLRGVASLSADRQWLLYAKSAPAAIGDTNGLDDIVLRHMPSATERCLSCFSLNLDGTPTNAPSNGASRNPTISSNGQSLTFLSQATNAIVGVQGAAGASTLVVGLGARLAPNPQNPAQLVPTLTGLSSPALSLQQALQAQAAAVQQAAIAQQNRHQLILSILRNIAGRKGAAQQEVHLLDLQTGTLSRISESATGEPANGDSSDFAVSGDGQTVVFRSMATNLDPTDPDTNGVADLYVRDLRSNTVRRLSRTRDGDEADAESGAPTLDYMGSRIAFESTASNFDGNDPDGGQVDLFLRLNPLNTDRVFGAGFE
jgi:Tol biopolymer transport system component